MSYKRVVLPPLFFHGNELNEALAGIGIRVWGKPAKNPNIEDTLLSATLESFELDDYRLLGLLTSWCEKHYRWINVDRLWRLVRHIEDKKVTAFWSSIAKLLEKDRRFSKLASLHVGPPLELLSVGNQYHIDRNGEDNRFERSCLLVPARVLRDRSTDVASPHELAAIHDVYRMRVAMGPSYRADMWAALTFDPEISASDLARVTYGSFATAWSVKRDWGVLHSVAA